MNKASPVEMRKALKMVELFKVAGILFVPLPIIDDADQFELIAEAAQRLEVLAETAEYNSQQEEE